MRFLELKIVKMTINRQYEVFRALNRQNDDNSQYEIFRAQNRQNDDKSQ